MTVQELMKKLSKYPPEARVLIDGGQPMEHGDPKRIYQPKAASGTGATIENLVFIKPSWWWGSL